MSKVTAPVTTGQRPFGRVRRPQRNRGCSRCPRSEWPSEVHIYNQQQDGSWFAQYLEAPSAQYSNAFGAAIAFGGGYLFVGDPSSNDGGGSNGIVHIYEDQAGSRTLVQSLKHTSASSNAGDNFGRSIAYANDHLFVGATRSEISSPTTDLTGSVYAFTLQSGQFVQEQELRAQPAWPP